MLDHTDRSLAKSAIDKLKLGQTPTAREAEALKRLQRDKDEQTRWEHYRTVPAKHYKEMSGRDARVLIDQQQRWGIPCAGKIVNLAAVIKAFHDFIASHIHRPLDAPDGGDASGSKSLERYRAALAEEKEMQVAAIRGELVPLAEAKLLVGENGARLVRCLGIVENTIATEFALWLNDPKVQAMSTEERTRLVREFVAATCDEVRRRECEDVRALLADLRADEETNADSGTTTTSRGTS